MSLARANVLKMEPYQPGKPVEEVKRELGLEEVIKLASNENPLGPAPKAIEAVQNAVQNMHFYPDGYAYELRQALSKFYGIPPDHLLFGNGSDEIIHFIGLAFLNPGEHLIMAHPSFTRYEASAHLNLAVLRQIPLALNARHDLKAMAKEVNEKTKLVFIANPNNPTGTLVFEEEVEEFLDRLPPHVIAVLDEAYYEYVDHPEYPNGLQYVRQGHNVIVLRTFSKAYGLAGLRIGYAFARPDLIEPMERVREPFNVNSLAQIAAIAALEDQEHVRQTRELNRRSLVYFYHLCERLQLEYIPSWANFVMINVKRSGKAVFQALLKKGIIVRSCEMFGMPTYIRVNTGTMEQNEKFAQALEEVLV